MALINDASQLYVGSTPVLAAYMNNVKVWPRSTAALAATLSAMANPPAGAPWYTVTTSFNGPTPAKYVFDSSTNGGPWVFRYEGGIGPHNFDTTYNSTFVMRVRSYSAAGVLLGEAFTNTVNSGPPPVTQVPKVVTLGAVEVASYKGNGAKRTDRSEMYFGYYDSTNGNQKSQARFNIPGDLRWCVAVTKVEVSIWGLHTHPNGGTTTELVIHHNSNLAAFGGSTGAVTHRSIGKPGWFGGSEWQDITGNTSPGRTTAAEEFRTQGAQGIGLRSVNGSTSQTYYGYARSDWRMRFSYTVNV